MALWAEHGGMAFAMASRMLAEDFAGFLVDDVTDLGKAWEMLTPKAQKGFEHQYRWTVEDGWLVPMVSAADHGRQFRWNAEGERGGPNKDAKHPAKRRNPPQPPPGYKSVFQRAYEAAAAERAAERAKGPPKKKGPPR